MRKRWITFCLFINRITYVHFMLCAMAYTVLLYVLGDWDDAVLFFCTMLSTVLMVGVIKVVTAMERPRDALVTFDRSDRAFPSGHAACMAFITVMVPYTAPWGFLPLTTGVLLFCTIVAALSRLTLRVHTLTQVVAGLILGVVLPYLIVLMI